MIRIITQVHSDDRHRGSATTITYYLFGIPFWRVLHIKRGGRYY